MESIIQSDKECYVCRTTSDLHSHHIYFGNSNRKQSEKYGMKVWLCGRHHNMSNEGVHFNKELNTHLKQLAQEVFEQETGNREQFRMIFGRSYI